MSRAIKILVIMIMFLVLLACTPQQQLLDDIEPIATVDDSPTDSPAAREVKEAPKATEATSEKSDAPTDKFDDAKTSIEEEKITPEITPEVTLETTPEIIPIKQKTIENIITFGDSLTYGHGLQEPKTQSWPRLLTNTFKQAKLTNYAISGSTSWGVTDQHLFFNSNLKHVIAEKNNLIFVWIGANDIINFIPKEQFETNLRKVLDDVTTLKNSKTIIINIPDVSKLSVAEDIDQQVNEALKEYGVQINVKGIGQELIRSYNDIITKLAQEYNIEMINMYTTMNEFDNTLISKDQFHPNEQGHQEIKKVIKQHLEDFYVEEELI